jgi:hypothetical protein
MSVLLLAVLATSAALGALVTGSARAAASGDYIYYDQLNPSTGLRSIYVMTSEGKDSRLFVPDAMEPDWTTTAPVPKMVFEQDSPLAEGDVDEAHCSPQGSSGGLAELVGTSGANPKLVKMDPTALPPCGDLVISADGTEIAYTAGMGGGGDPQVLVQSLTNPANNQTIVPVPEQDECYSLTNDDLSGPSEACAAGLEPIFANDSTVAFFGDGSAGGIYRLSTTGSDDAPVTWLAPVEQQPDSNDVPMVIPLEGMAFGHGVLALGGSAYPLSTTSLDPEGIWLTQPSGAAGQAGTEIAIAPTGHVYRWPQFSDNGQLITFEDDFTSTSGVPLSTVDTVPVDGGKVTVLTSPSQRSSDPTFGPAPLGGCGQVVFGDATIRDSKVTVPVDYVGGTNPCHAFLLLYRPRQFQVEGETTEIKTDSLGDKAVTLEHGKRHTEEISLDDHGLSVLAKQHRLTVHLLAVDDNGTLVSKFQLTLRFEEAR